MHTARPLSSIRSRRPSLVTRGLFEPLEGRALMTAITVTNLADSGAGSLRAAVTAAVNGDTISFGNLKGTVTLASTLDLGGKDLTIVGSGRKNLTLDGSGLDQAIKAIGGEHTIAVSDLTIDGGDAGTMDGAGLKVTGEDSTNKAMLTLTNVDVVGGKANYYGGGLYTTDVDLIVSHCNFFGNDVAGSSAYGGALYTQSGTLTIDSSAFYDNTARVTGSNGCYGGAIYAYNVTADIKNTTIANNTLIAADGISYTYFEGSGIYLNGEGSFVNDTITGNGNVLGAASNYGSGGALFLQLSDATTIKNSIFAGNSTLVSKDLYVRLNGQALTLANNFVGTTTNAGVPSSPSSQYGTDSSPLAPGFGTLGYHGGAVATVPLLVGSAAIDAGTAVGAPTLDARSIARNGSVDVGAFEYVPTPSFSGTPRLTIASGATGGTLSSSAAGGTGAISYQWTRLTKPTHAADPILADPTHDSTAATFAKAGTYVYRLTATDANGLSVMRRVTFTIEGVATSLRIVQHKQSFANDKTTKMRAYVFDQFGGRLAEQPTIRWAVLEGSGTISRLTGFYRPDATVANDRVRFEASAGDLTGTAVDYVRA